MLNKVLVIQTAFIGDVILATPLVENLRDFFPEARIDFLLRKGNEGLLANNPHITKTWIFDKKQNKYRNLFRLIKALRAEQYDLVVNCQRFLTTGLISVFSGAKTITGFKKNPFAFLFHHQVAHVIDLKQPFRHEVERNLQLISHLGQVKTQRPVLYPREEDEESNRQEQPYITISPASVWHTKQLPVHKWIALVDALQKYKVLLLGGPSDVALCDEIIDKTRHPDIISFAGEYHFLQSAAIMKHAKMNYVNDSAPLHLASGVNAPVTAVFCSTVPHFGFTPLSDNHKIVETKESLDCRPCGLHGKKKCPLGHFKCANISVEQLLFKE